MGEYLSSRGYSVLGIRLAGHATRPEDLIRTRRNDWLTTCEEGYHLLSCVADQIYVAGLSMGGILALIFGAQFQVKGIVAMSTPFTLPADPRLSFAQWLHWIKPEIPKSPPDWHNPDAALDHIDYPTYSTRAIAELRNLIIDMHTALPKIKSPTLLVQSRNDRTITPDSMDQIFSRLGCENKQTLWVNNSGHVVVREPDRRLIFDTVDRFICSISRLDVKG